MDSQRPTARFLDSIFCDQFMCESLLNFQQLRTRTSREQRRDEEEEEVKHLEKECVLDLSSTRVEMHEIYRGIFTAVF